jgi:peptidoglycan hydrolase CwlO-like protein
MKKKKPTIDERLEALTHSVELIASMQQQTEREIQQTQRQIKSLGRLVRTIAVDHENRLSALEGGAE